MAQPFLIQNSTYQVAQPTTYADPKNRAAQLNVGRRLSMAAIV